MLGIILFAVCLAAFGFEKEEPPASRAAMTALAAWFFQSFSLAFLLGGTDNVWSEEALIGTAFRAGLAIPVGFALFWWFKRQAQRQSN